MVLTIIYLFSLKLDKADTSFRVRLLTVSMARESTPYYGLYRKAPPESGIFFRLQVYERVGVSLVEVYKRVRKSVISVCKRTKKG